MEMNFHHDSVAATVPLRLKIRKNLKNRSRQTTPANQGSQLPARCWSKATAIFGDSGASSAERAYRLLRDYRHTETVAATDHC
jgi:hypothetical protein